MLTLLFKVALILEATGQPVCFRIRNSCGKHYRVTHTPILHIIQYFTSKKTFQRSGLKVSYNNLHQPRHSCTKGQRGETTCLDLKCCSKEGYKTLSCLKPYHDALGPAFLLCISFSFFFPSPLLLNLFYL